MTVKRIKKGKYAYLWRATIDFKTSYAKKGHSELFETDYDARDWIRSIKNKR